MDFSQLSEENHDIELSKVFAKIDKIVSPKELKRVKQEKESLVVQLSESHVLIDSLRSENTVLLNIIDELENKLAKLSSDNLKSMLCIHSDVSNKPDLSTSTSHASDS
jgi:GTP-binding protein EngB required for normal cell division